jgi:hypothetical protein
MCGHDFSRPSMGFDDTGAFCASERRLNAPDFRKTALASGKISLFFPLVGKPAALSVSAIWFAVRL